MKKLLVLLGIVALVLAGLNWFNPELFYQLRQSTGMAPRSTVLYKWQDASGQWLLTDKPPPEGTPFEVKEYLHDSNVVPPLDRDKRK